MPFVQQRRGTKAQLEAANEIPLDGQLIIEEQLDGFQMIKIGDGVTHYNSLDYLTQKLQDLSDVDTFVSPSGPDGQTLVRNNGNNFTETYVPYAAIGPTPLGNYPAGSLGEKIATKVDNTDARLTDERVPTDNSVSTAKIEDDAVTFAKMQDVNANRLLGSVSAGSILEISCKPVGRDLLDSADEADARSAIGAVDQAAVNTSITNAVAGTANIADDAVTYAKLQNVGAGKVLGNDTTLSGNVKEIDSTLFGRSLLNVADGASLVATLGVSTTSQTTAAINSVIDSAPGALDTLNELAAAIGDDASFSTTVTNSIATKMPLAGGTFTGEVIHQTQLFSGFYAVGTNILDAATIASGNGDRSLLNDAATIAKVREIEFARGKRVAGLTNVSNVPSSNQTNYNSPADNKHWQWTGSAWQQVAATGQTWIGQYSTVVAHDWGQSLSDDTNAETNFQRILLYEDGSSTNVAGMGVSVSNFNIGTKGAINVSFYAQGNLNERKTGALSRHYVDQYNNGKIYTAGGSAALPVISKEGDADTGIYYPSLGAFAITADGDEKVKVTNNEITVSRTAGYPTIKADATGVDGSAGGWMIIDSVSNPVSLNFYSSANVQLAYGGGGATVGTVAQGSYKFRVYGGQSHFSHDVVIGSGAVYAPNYRVQGSSSVAGSTTLVAVGQQGDNDTGIYFPAANQTGISAGGNNRVNFNLNASTFYRNANQPTIKADAGNSGYMIIDSAGSYLSLNHYVGDDILLCYATGGSGNVIIGASTTTNPNPSSRKLLVEGDTETKGITYSDRYIADTNGSAADPAFEIDGTIDGTGWYTPSSTVNGGNSAGYGFAIAASHSHVAEFGYKSHIGNGRPTIYGGAAAALLELNGNSRRGSLFGYNIYATSASSANAAIGGEFLCIAQGGTSANSPKGFKAKLQSQSANGTSAVGGHFELSLESVTGSWINAYGVHCELNIESSCTGTLNGTAAALFIDAVGKTSNATYTQTDGVDRVYAIFQTGNSDNNRFDGTSWFRNNVHIVDSSDLDISSGIGQIILSNGSANDPAICFGADTDTGMYYDSGLALGFAGSQKVLYQASFTTFLQQTRIPDGTATAPSIAFSSSTNTGISYSSNNLNLVYAGGNRISIGGGGVIVGNVPTTLNGAVSITQGLALSEIAQSGASTGQTLQWDGTAWVPATVSGGGGGSTTVGGLSDVTVSSAADNNLLRYDSANSRWENYSPDGFSTGSGANTAINLADGNKIHQWTPPTSGVCQVVLLNVPSGSGISCSFTLVIKYSGSAGQVGTAVVQWPASIKWPGGVVPTLTNRGGKQDTFTFLSLDNGGSWLGHTGGQNF